MCAHSVRIIIVHLNRIPLQRAGEESLANLDNLYHKSQGDTPTAEWRLNMQRVMHNNAGVYRSGKFLKDGCDQISKLAVDMEKNLKVHNNHCTCIAYCCIHVYIPTLYGGHV